MILSICDLPVLDTHICSDVCVDLIFASDKLHFHKLVMRHFLRWSKLSGLQMKVLQKTAACHEFFMTMTNATFAAEKCSSGIVNLGKGVYGLEDWAFTGENAADSLEDIKRTEVDLTMDNCTEEELSPFSRRDGADMEVEGLEHGSSAPSPWRHDMDMKMGGREQEKSVVLQREGFFSSEEIRASEMTRSSSEFATEILRIGVEDLRQGSAAVSTGEDVVYDQGEETLQNCSLLLHRQFGEMQEEEAKNGGYLLQKVDVEVETEEQDLETSTSSSQKAVEMVSEESEQDSSDSAFSAASEMVTRYTFRRKASHERLLFLMAPFFSANISRILLTFLRCCYLTHPSCFFCFSCLLKSYAFDFPSFSADV